VQEVPAEGPAAAAGLRPEDVIVAVDGADIERSAQLQSLIAQRRPGDEVTIEFYRDGRPQQLDVTLGQAPINGRTAQAPSPEPTVTALLGLEFLPLDAARAQELGYATPGGVVTGSVSPVGPAGREGIVGGERVLEVGRIRAGDRVAVQDVEDVQEVLAGLERGDIVSLRLQRPEGSPFVVNLRVPE
jgi:S1-C subfamily serine protease